MRQSSLEIKLIALFVVAFVCLNAGGAVCVAYCRSTLESVASAEHCPLQKAKNHCDHQATEDANESASAIRTNPADCCPMTISFIGAPIEKRSAFFEQAVVPAEVVPGQFVFSYSFKPFSPSIDAYRGPPLDRRGDRLKHRLIRI